MSVSTVDAPIAPKSILASTLTMDRRRQERRIQDSTTVDNAPTKSRRTQQRRRFIDPTTCERDYSEGEVEFMKAMDDYKQTSGRMFPTCSEVLEVLHGLGYVQLDDTQFAQLGLEKHSPVIDADDSDLDTEVQ